MKWLASRLSQHDYRTGFLLVMAFLSLFPLLGFSPLFDEDEGYYAAASREMVEKGNYLTPHINGLPQYDKPILIFWLQAISFKVFGLNEFAARFPSALATFLWMLAIFRLARRHAGRSSAFLAALFFITAVQVTITGKAAIVDSVLNLFLTLCMGHLYEYMQNRNHQIYLAAFYAGLAFLAKGPVAVVIPFGVSFLYCLVQKEMRLWLKMVFNPLAILIFAILALPWYILEYLDQGTIFIQEFFLKHNLERFSRTFEGHSGSLFYYVPVIIAGTLPHCGLLIPLCRQARVLLKQDFYRFCYIWIAFVIVLFSLGGTKLPHYIISAFPPLFILYGVVYERLERLRSYLIPATVFLGILCMAPLAIPVVRPFVHDAFAACVMGAAQPLFGPGYYLSCGVLAAVMLLILVRRAGSMLTAVGVSVVYLILINLVAMPRIGELLQFPVREVAQIVSRTAEPVIMWGRSMPSVWYYAGKYIEIRDPAPGDLLVTKKTRLAEVGPNEILYEKNCIVLVRVLKPG